MNKSGSAMDLDGITAYYTEGLMPAGREKDYVPSGGGALLFIFDSRGVKSGKIHR